MMKKLFLLFFICTLSSFPQERQHTLSGAFRYHKNFHSKYLEKERDIIIYLPPQYGTTTQRFSVLYMHDGQNIFNGATSFIPGMEWRVDEAAQTLIDSNSIEPIIIVGVYNTSDRMAEYTPTQSFDSTSKAFGLGGNGDAYGRMLVEELKSFIDSTYRTLRDAQHTALAGSSLGALITLHLGLKYPNIFSKLAVVSPSVWWDKEMIVKEVNALHAHLPLQIWLDVGTKEGDDKTVDDAMKLRDALLAKQWGLNKDLFFYIDESAEHNEHAWSVRMPMILKYLFPKK